VLRNSNITSSIDAPHPIRNKGISPALKAQFSSAAISF